MSFEIAIRHSSGSLSLEFGGRGEVQGGPGRDINVRARGI